MKKNKFIAQSQRRALGIPTKRIKIEGESRNRATGATTGSSVPTAPPATQYVGILTITQMNELKPWLLAVTLGSTGNTDLAGGYLAADVVKIHDDDDSHELSLVWNEAETAANRSLNFLVHAGNRTLDLAENLKVDNGYNVTLQALGQANSLILNESLTVGDGNSGTLTFSVSGKVLTVPVTAVQVEVEEIGTSTYDDLQDLINNTLSSGYVEGGLITATSPADGTIAISAIKGFLKSTDSEIGVTQSFDLAGTTDFELTNNDTNYIYVDFVSGPRFQVTTTRSDIELNRQFLIGRVYRKDNETHIIQSGIQLPNFVRESHERLVAVRGFEQASGGAISESGNRYIASTGGIFYLGNNKIETTGVDTDGTPTFTRHYHSGGVWTSDEKSQICAADYQYDNGTALANLSNNKYGVFWVFVHFDSDLHVVVGRGNYTLAEAQAATVPALPNIVSDFSALAAKIIIEEDDTNFLTVQGAYERFFPLSGAFEHNDSGAIQGGTTDEYYHLLSAEYTELSEWLDNVTLGSNGLTTVPEVVLVPRAAALNDVQGGMYYSNVDDSIYVCTSDA